MRVLRLLLIIASLAGLATGITLCDGAEIIEVAGTAVSAARSAVRSVVDTEGIMTVLPCFVVLGLAAVGLVLIKIIVHLVCFACCCYASRNSRAVC